MMRWKNVVLCSLFLCVMGSVPVYADEYTLTAESYASDPQNSSAPSLDVNSWLATVPDDMDFDTYQEIMALMHPELADDYEEEELLDEDDSGVASSSTARRSRTNVTYNNVSVASNYVPDNDQISTSVLQYFRDMVVKLPYGTDYVFFRVNDYEYRLVYGKELRYSNGVFSGSDMSYVRYYRQSSGNYYYDWLLASGSEGDFKLTPNGYMVYTNVPEADLYPTMSGGVYSYETYAVVFVLVLTLLFNIVHAFFFVGKYRI